MPRKGLSVFFLLFSTIFLPTQAAFAQGLYLAASRAFVMEGRTEAVALADFNEDGHLDLVVALTGSDPGDGRIGVALGNGGGELGAPVVLQTTRMNSGAANQRKIVAEDVNADGHVDIVVANDTGGTLSLFLGVGNGSFLPRRDVVAGTRPIGLAAGDFNRDGKLDVVAVDGPWLRLFWGTGNGPNFFFTPGASLRLNWIGNSIAVADWDGDGWPDIAATASRNSSGPSAISELHVFLNNGDNSFTKLAKPGTYATLRFDPHGKSPMWLLPGDFDGDRRLDLAVVNRDSDSVVLLKGDGSGNFLFPPLAVISVGFSPTFLAAGDIDGDGRLDLVTVNRGGNSLSILKGHGGAGFEVIEQIPVGKNPSAVALADLDEDGSLDLVVTHSHPLSNSIHVLRGDGHGRFDNAPAYATGAGPQALVVGDFNHDGHQDLLVANEGSDTVSLFLGHGDGRFTPALTLPTGRGPRAVAVGHFGRPRHGKEKTAQARFLDFAVANSRDGSVTIYLGGPGLAFTRAADLSVGNTPVHLVVFDANRDGHLDLAVANNGSGDIALLLGSGAGSFQAPTYLQPLRSGGGLNRPQGVAVGTFNGDKRQDLVTNSQFFPHVSLFRGVGDGSFTVTGALEGESTITRLAVADLDGDGNLDLAASSGASSRNVMVFLGDGRGGFAPGVPYFSGATMREIAAADLRGLGLIDLVVTNQHFDNVSLLTGSGLGAFTAPTYYAIGADPFGLAVGDFDEDGLPDLAVTSLSGNQVFIVLNRTEFTRVTLKLTPQALHLRHGRPHELRAVVHFADPTFAASVDPTSITLAGIPALDATLRGRTLHATFSAQPILEGLGGAIERRTVTLVLQGAFQDGRVFAGRDQVKVEPGKPADHGVVEAPRAAASGPANDPPVSVVTREKRDVTVNGNRQDPVAAVITRLHLPVRRIGVGRDAPRPTGAEGQHPPRAPRDTSEEMSRERFAGDRVAVTIADAAEPGRISEPDDALVAMDAPVLTPDLEVELPGERGDEPSL